MIEITHVERMEIASLYDGEYPAMISIARFDADHVHYSIDLSSLSARIVMTTDELRKVAQAMLRVADGVTKEQAA